MPASAGISPIWAALLRPSCSPIATSSLNRSGSFSLHPYSLSR